MALGRCCGGVQEKLSSRSDVNRQDRQRLTGFVFHKTVSHTRVNPRFLAIESCSALNSMACWSTCDVFVKGTQ